MDSIALNLFAACFKIALNQKKLRDCMDIAMTAFIQNLISRSEVCCTILPKSGYMVVKCITSANHIVHLICATNDSNQEKGRDEEYAIDFLKCTSSMSSLVAVKDIVQKDCRKFKEQEPSTIVLINGALQ